MSLSKRITLTIKDYSMTLSGNLNFYVNDCLDLVFEINKWGIDNKKATVNDSKFDLTGITAYLFVENSNLVDSIEATKIEDNEITFKFTNKYTILVGKGRMQIKLVDEDGCELKLPPFNYNIESTINEFADMNPDNESVLVSEDGAVLLTEDGKLLMIPSEFNNPNLVKISDLPVVDSLKYTDDLLVNNNGVTKRVPVSDVKISTEQAEYISKIPEITSQLEHNTIQTLISKNNNRYSNAKNKNVVVTFIDDDGDERVSTILKPIFTSRNIPCCCALIGTSKYFSDATLKQDMLNLQNNNNWEIMSHTMTHINLKESTDVQIEKDCIDFQALAIKNGYKVDSIVYPWGQTSTTGEDIIAKYYTSAFSTTPNANYTDSLNVYRIRRYALGSMMPTGQDTFEFFKTQIDSAIASGKKVWLVFMMHCGANTPEQTALTTQVIDYLLSVNVDILNSRDALRSHGTALFTPNLKIQADGGVITDKLAIPKVISPKLETDGIDVGEMKINVFTATGWSLGNGIVTEYIHATGWQYQEFRKSGSNANIWTRKWTGTAWKPWQKYAISYSNISYTMPTKTIPANSTLEVTAYDTSIMGADAHITYPSGALENGLVWSSWSIGNGAIKIRLANVTTSAITTAEQVWNIKRIS